MGGAGGEFVKLVNVMIIMLIPKLVDYSVLWISKSSWEGRSLDFEIGERFSHLVKLKVTNNGQVDSHELFVTHAFRPCIMHCA